jgi:murein L,D-transpeptidase YcbB/YkuD
MFPNEHAVYLHDTPTRNLFANGKRAFSHGCVRVDQPFALAEIVLGEGWTEERVKALKGGGERMVKMPRPLQIHIGYFSAFVDEHGKLQLREDIYGYSQKVRAALGLSA